jgi:hypothetical protein
MAVAVDVVEGLAAKFAALLPHLDERQRRLALGAEARSLGHGGVKAVTEAAGVSAVTVSAGVAELEAGHEPLVRARRPGGGRKKLAVTDPGLKAALLALVEPSSRGDPESPLRWTTRSLRNLAAELGRAGHRASAPTVAGLLREEHFSLQGNARAAEGRQHPDRDAQFRYITEQARAHQAAGQPVVSVDAKKKENVGNFKNGGREWRPGGDPGRVNVHDFIGKELGKAVPYGGVRHRRGRRVGQRGHRPRHRSVRGPDDPHLVADRRPARLPRRDAVADLRRRRRVRRLPHAAVEDRAGGAGRRDRAGDHRLPLPARHLQVEQNRAPAVQPHLDELARPATDQSRGHRQPDREHAHPHRSDRRRRTRPGPVPQGHQDQRPGDARPRAEPAPPAATTGTPNGTTASAQ